jgi:hypothetical protein
VPALLLTNIPGWMRLRFWIAFANSLPCCIDQLQRLWIMNLVFGHTL